MLLTVDVASSGDSGVVRAVGFVVLDDVIVGVELPPSDGVVVMSTVVASLGAVVVVVHVTIVVCSVVDIAGGGVVGITGTTLLGGKI